MQYGGCIDCVENGSINGRIPAATPPVQSNSAVAVVMLVFISRDALALAYCYPSFTDTLSEGLQSAQFLSVIVRSDSSPSL